MAYGQLVPRHSRPFVAAINDGFHNLGFTATDSWDYVYLRSIPAAVRETAVMLFRTTGGGVTLVVMRDEIGGIVTGKGG